MRRLISALALILSPMSIQGQVPFEIQNTNFVATQNGFTETILFRNVQQYGAPQAIATGQMFLSVSQRLQTFCAPSNIVCSILGLGPMFVGNVQHNRFTIAGNTYDPGTPLIGNSFGQDDTFSQVWDPLGSAVLFGCQLPIVQAPDLVRTYYARTCAAEGFDGFLGINVFFQYSVSGSMSPPSILPPFAFSAADAELGLSQRIIVGPTLFVTPEPATLLLMAGGLLAIGMVSRRAPGR
jgi:hypothetical protein